MTGNVWPLRPHLRQHFEPAHAGHVDVGQNQDQGGIPDFAGANQLPPAPKKQIPSGSARI
jgi:hypothetical protein